MIDEPSPTPLLLPQHADLIMQLRGRAVGYDVGGLDNWLDEQRTTVDDDARSGS